MSEQGLVTTQELAKFLEIEPRTVQLLAKNGTIPQEKRNQFAFLKSIRAYIIYLRDLAKNKIPAGDVGARKLLAETEEREAKARKARYQADLMEGKLLKLEEVSRQWTGRYIELKAALLEFPKRAAFRFTDPEARLLVEEEAHAIVTEMLERYSRDGILPGQPGPDSSLGAGTPTKKPEAAPVDKRKRVGGRKPRS